MPTIAPRVNRIIESDLQQHIQDSRLCWVFRHGAPIKLAMKSAYQQAKEAKVPDKMDYFLDRLSSSLGMRIQ